MTEDMDIVPPDQPLYCPVYIENIIKKIDKNVFKEFVNDLLILQAGEEGHDAVLCIVHWDGADFVVRRLAFTLNRSQYPLAHLEHVSFAPLDLPSVE